MRSCAHICTETWPSQAEPDLTQSSCANTAREPLSLDLFLDSLALEMGTREMGAAGIPQTHV